MASTPSASSPLSFNIEGCVALVTGTNKSNGIGAHLVRALLEHGAAKVYATARDSKQVEYLVQEEGNGKVVAVQLDVTDLKAIEELPTKLPDVTLLINNAGFMSTNTCLQSTETARKEIEVNYIAPMALVKSFAPVLEASSATKTTAVININSIAGVMNFYLAETYSAAKAASHSLTHAQRRHLPHSLVMGVYPGPIDTDLSKEVTEFPKATARDVALALMKALKNGDEDVFPDPMSQQLIEGWKADAKAMEKQMTAMANEAA